MVLRSFSTVLTITLCSCFLYSTIPLLRKFSLNFMTTMRNILDRIYVNTTRSMYLHMSDRTRKMPHSPVSINYSFLLFAKLMRIQMFIRNFSIRVSGTISVWSLLRATNVNTMRNLKLFLHVLLLVFISRSISGSDVMFWGYVSLRNGTGRHGNVTFIETLKVSKYGKCTVSKQPNAT